MRTVKLGGVSDAESENSMESVEPLSSRALPETPGTGMDPKLCVVP